MRHALAVAGVHHEAIYAADLEFVMNALTDKAFLAEYAQEVGALESDVAVDLSNAGIQTRVRMVVPTSGVPQPFKKLVTPTVEIREWRRWHPATDEQRRMGRVTVDAEVGRRKAHVRGGLEVAALAEGSRFRVGGDITVNLRLLEDQAARLIAQLVGNVLNQQAKVMARWIEA